MFYLPFVGVSLVSSLQGRKRSRVEGEIEEHYGLSVLNK